MAFVLGAGDIIKSTIVVVSANQTALLDMFWLCGIRTGAGATDQNFVDQLDLLINTDIKGLIANGAVYHGCMAQVINPPPIKRRVFNVINAGNGTGGVNQLPTQVSGIISWRTSLAGRTQRGRTFLPFPSTAMNTAAGLPTTSYQTAANNLASVLSLYTSVPGAGSQNIALSVFHREFNSTDAITDALVPDVWGTQKRRGSLGKANVPPI